MIIGIHSTQDNRLMLSICDKDLLGKYFEDGNAQLDLSSAYYRGEEKNEEETARLLRQAYSAHIVGKQSVAFCISQGVIDRENVQTVDGVPHGYLMRF